MTGRKAGSMGIALALSMVSLLLSPNFLTGHASTTTTYSATETIPVPPASAYGGSGGGDGWGIALSSDRVYNVFHHSAQLVVACHLQSDASPCWNPETITDSSGNNFATSGQPGLWLDQASGHLYVYATRTSDATGGVVCIDTTSASTNPNPFCGFTALTAVGAAQIYGGISFISDPMRVGTHWYAFNYVNGAAASSTQNNLLCFDLTTFAGCASQPFTVGVGAGTVSDGSFPAPATAGITGHLIIPISVGGTNELACFDATTLANCAGSWPVSLAFGYDSVNGAPFPLMTATGAIDGFCLPTGSDPCYDFTGATATTPSGLTGVISGTTGWNGPAFVLGPRAYVPNGNADQVQCFDYSTSLSCTNFPKSLPGLGYLYTVNADPQRPTCIWVNADNGADQIQNFDAYSAGACGQGPIRVLASSLVVNTQLCVPATYTALQVQSPPPGSYTSGTVSFEDGDANPIAGTPTLTLDATGSVDLNGLSLNTAQGLPQFLITLTGAPVRPTSVTVQLTWTGVSDPSCVPPGSSCSPNVAVFPNAADATKTDLDGTCFTPGETVDVLLNTEAGAILVDQKTALLDGSVLDTFKVPTSFNVPLPKAKGFKSVIVPVQSSITYQLDVIGEKSADGASLQVQAQGSGALNVIDAKKTTSTRGPGCSPASIVVESPLPLPAALMTSSRWIEDQNGNRVKLHSVNWYGAEQADFIPGGLDCQSISTIAAQVRYDFNTVRLPWSNAMLEEDPGSCAASPAPIDRPCITPGLLLANPTLANLDAIGIYRQVVRALGQQGVMVVLDDHTTDAQWSPGPKNGIWWGGQLWDDVVNQSVQCPGGGASFHCWHQRMNWWKNDWITMVNLFQSEANVIGFDLRNEPNNGNSYGITEIWCSETKTQDNGNIVPGTCPVDSQNQTSSPNPQPTQDEWGPSAEWAGNAILAATGPNPRFIVFVEGLNYGADLRSVYNHPLALQPTGHLVYSPHSYHNYDVGIPFLACLIHCDYGNISHDDLFTALGNAWGFILKQSPPGSPPLPYTAPIWVGEFGVCNTSDACTSSTDGSFRANFLDYLKQGDIDWSYWPLNGTYSDGGSSALDKTWFAQETYGILNTTWSAPQPTALLGMLPENCTQGPGC